MTKRTPAPPFTARTAVDDLPMLLMRATKAFVTECVSGSAAEAPADKTSFIGTCISRYLADHDPVTAAELASHFTVTKQSMSELLAALEEDGRIRRVPHPADRRARVIQLTAKGRKALAADAERWARVEADFEQLVGARRVQELRATLEAYLDARHAEA